MADLLRHSTLVIAVFRLFLKLSYFPFLAYRQQMRKIGELLTLLDRVELTQAVRLEAIQLRKQKKIKLPDAIIAASAINRNATLLTND